jgi:nucleotide-binding universal stress UspA family protein
VKRSSDRTGGASKVGFGHIIVAVDGSTNGRRAAEFAANLALGLGSRLTVVTVVEPPNVPRLVTMDPRFLPDYHGMIDSLREAAEAQGRHLLEEVGSLVKKSTGLKPDVRLEMGPIRETLMHTVSKLHPDLLVVGTRGMTGVRRFIVGNVSEAMVRHAPCSVVVVR